MREALRGTRTFWTTEANHKRVAELGEGPIRSYPYTFMTPITALSVEGEPIVLHPNARRITVSCNLSALLSRTAKDVTREESTGHIAEYRVLAVLKDWFWLDAKPKQTVRDRWAWGANYSRWTDGFSCLSQTAVTPEALPDPYRSRIWLAIDGVGEVTSNSADYLHTFGDILGYLSRTITFSERDIIDLGCAGEVLTISPEHRLPEGTMLRAEIEGIGRMETPIVDRRELD